LIQTTPGKEAQLFVEFENGSDGNIRLLGAETGIWKRSTFEIGLDFDFGPVDMPVQVEAANATRHSHAGHLH
jgi:hypothetical protein